MFFSWYVKNRHFKAGGNLSGQITPFLLIVLVVLLIAVMATVNLGRISLDKTCSANGADAGSLAAASTWAGAFNQLAEMNKDLREYHDLLYPDYAELYHEANDYITEAMTILSLVPFPLAAMIADVPPPPFLCGTVYPTLFAAFVQSCIVMWLLYETSKAVTAFEVAVQGLKTLTDSFHEGQGWRYCNYVSFMQSSYIISRKQGLSYAFSNSCISNKLSSSPPAPQIDDFNAWLAKFGPYEDGVYSWKDKAEQDHTVSSTLDLPDIENYRIQPTKGSYNDISGLLDGLINKSEQIRFILRTMIEILIAANPLWLFGASVTLAILLACWPFPWCAAAFGVLCPIMEAAYPTAYWALFGLTAMLVLLVLPGELWIDSLRDDNNEAFLDWEIKESPKSGFPLGKVCVDGLPSDDIKNYMIVKIDEIFLTKPEWKTTCCVTQTHPDGVATGIFPTKYPVVTSCGTSEFAGGDVGTFNGHVEDPSDPYAYNPQIKYDPSMTDAN